MKKLSILFAAFLLLAVNLTAVAQDEEEEKDFMEMNLYGGLGIPAGGISSWQDTLGAKTGFGFGLDLGYFLKPNMVIGLNIVYSQFGIDAEDEAAELHHRLYNPNFYLKYYFQGESNFEPYIKAHVGVENPKFTTFVGNFAGNRYREKTYDPALAFGFGAGVFYYTADFSGLFLEVNYHHALTEDSKAEYGGEEYLFGENLGLVDVHAGVRILIGS